MNTEPVQSLAETVRQMDQTLYLSSRYIAGGEEPAPYCPDVLKRWRLSISAHLGPGHWHDGPGGELWDPSPPKGM